MAHFSNRLKLLRKEHNLSQMELARQLGCVSKSSVNMYERGEREPSFETLEAIADYFNVDLDYLLGKSDVPNRYRDLLADIAKENESGRPLWMRCAAGSEQNTAPYPFTPVKTRKKSPYFTIMHWSEVPRWR